MIDARVVVDMLTVAHEVQAAELTAAARMRDVDGYVVAHQSAAEVECGVTEICVTTNGDGEMAGLAMAEAAILQADQVNLCAILNRQVDDGIGEVPGGAARFVKNDDVGVAVGCCFDVNTNLRHARDG